ncbi:MAG: hypothetical protein KKA79_04575 [Nanoarchaeota archaeon]|nr:hypothetical protein [Nanoarchaeota archaeon]
MGGTNLEIQGVGVKANDIDILTDEKGAYEIGKALKEYETEPVGYTEKTNFPCHRGEFMIDDIEIEVIGEQNDENIIIIDMGSFEIPCRTLESEYKSYIRLGREEKAKLIKKKLDS